MDKQPTLIQGGIHDDARGTLAFVNGFDMTTVKRFYLIEHPNTDLVRAWQGHKQEQKWFFVVKGAFEIALVQPDDWSHPSQELKPQIFRLSEKDPMILYVPGGFANGFRALESESKMIVYSSAGLEESTKDDYRFDKALWYDWN